MVYKVLLAGLWGGIVAMDTTSALQLMISHPIVSGSVIGLLFGNLPLGFFIGTLLELPWLFEIPAGSARFAEGNVGSVTAAAITVHLFQQTGRLELSSALAIFVGIIVSIVGGMAVVSMRRSNAHLLEWLSLKERISPRDINIAQFIGLIKAFFLGVLITSGSFVLFGYFLLPYVISNISTAVDPVFNPLFGALLGVGCTVLFMLIITKKNLWMLLMGIVLGALTMLM